MSAWGPGGAHHPPGPALPGGDFGGAHSSSNERLTQKTLTLRANNSTMTEFAVGGVCAKGACHTGAGAA